MAEQATQETEAKPNGKAKPARARARSAKPKANGKAKPPELTAAELKKRNAGLEAQVQQAQDQAEAARAEVDVLKMELESMRRNTVSLLTENRKQARQQPPKPELVKE